MREDDGSVYKCTVTNEDGSAEATTTVTVFCKLLKYRCKQQRKDELDLIILEGLRAKRAYIGF